MSKGKDHSKKFECYLQGEMTPQEAHDFERTVLDDPFAQEALEGFENNPGIIHDIARLKGYVLAHGRVTPPWMRMAAAAALLILGVSTVYFFSNKMDSSKLVSLQQELPGVTPEPPLSANDTLVNSTWANVNDDNSEAHSQKEVPQPEKVSEQAMTQAIDAEPMEEIEEISKEIAISISGREDFDEVAMEKLEIIDSGVADLQTTPISNSIATARTAVSDLEGESFGQERMMVNLRRLKDEKNTIGYSASSFEQRKAEPVVGFEKYASYLSLNLRYPAPALENKIEGTVVLQLTISTDGSISHIAIQKSLGYGCDEEAIRLVKEGPKWKASEQEREAIEDKIEVMVYFELD